MAVQNMSVEAALACFSSVLAPPPDYEGEAPVPPPHARPEYYVLRSVGGGVSGTAFLAQRISDGHKLIAKITNLSNLNDKKKGYARSEIKCLADCDHFAIVRHYANYESDDGSHLLLVMELADAGDLSRQIKHRAKEGTPFREHEVAFLFLQVVLGVHYIHEKRMLHRDIKSANVFLLSCGITKIGDFGFSQQYEDTVSGAVAGTFCGTPYYLAPELWKRQRYSKKADVWSRGILLYEIAALRRPFVSSTMVGLMDKVMGGVYEPLPATYSEGMHDLVKKMLCFDPNGRPDTRQILAHPYMVYVLQQFEITIRDSTQFEPTEKESILAQLATAKAQASEVAAAEVAAEAADESAVQCRGVVYKFGSRGWKQRYLTLTSGILTVSLVPASAGETKTLPLKHIVSVDRVGPELAEGREFVFTLQVDSGMDLMFQAQSEEECVDWVTKIRQSLVVSG